MIGATSDDGDKNIEGVNYNILGMSRNEIKNILARVIFLHKCKAEGTIMGSLTIIKKQNIHFPTS